MFAETHERWIITLSTLLYYMAKGLSVTSEVLPQTIGSKMAALSCIACLCIPVTGAKGNKTIPAWQCLCAQSKVHKDMVCRVWCEWIKWPAQGSDFIPTEHLLRLIETLTASQASAPTQCLTSLMLLMLKRQIPIAILPNLVKSPSRTVEINLEWMLRTSLKRVIVRCPQPFGHILYNVYSITILKYYSICFPNLYVLKTTSAAYYAKY